MLGHPNTLKAVMRKSILLLFFTIICYKISHAQSDTTYDNSFIHFHLYGKGEPVFVLSGGPGNDCHQEEDVAIKIGEKYMAILLEQRGTGLSMPQTLDKNSINLAAYIKDILFVMDSLKITKAKFYGHSWGAMLASAFAVQYPDKVTSLILTGTGFLKLDNDYQTTIFKNRMAKLSDEQRKRFNKLSWISTDKMTQEEKKELADLRATFNTFDTSNKEWKFAKINRGISNAITQNLVLQDLQRNGFDLTQKVKQLAMPITIITCKEDPLAFLTEEYKKFAPQSEIRWLEHCGHFPMYEKPEDFYPLLSEALKR